MQDAIHALKYGRLHPASRGLGKLLARAIAGLLDDPVALAAMGRAARRRAEASFDYDLLAPRLQASLGDVNG